MPGFFKRMLHGGARSGDSASPTAPDAGNVDSDGGNELSAIPWFAFDGTAWVDATTTSPATNLPNWRPFPATSALRLATLNVLADCWPWLVLLATPPAVRVPGLIAALATLEADIVALNEVTPSILATVLADEGVRVKFPYSTHIPATIGPQQQQHGVVLLSAFRFANVWHASPKDDATGADVEQKRPSCVVELAVGGDGNQPDGETVAIAAIHTVAHNRGSRRELRRHQIVALAGLLRRRGSPFVLMGDLNLHDADEEAAIADAGLLDVWLETHPNLMALQPVPNGNNAGGGDGSSEDAAAGTTSEGDEADYGYTFDARRNTMIPRYMPGEQRRLRLDRILVPRGFPWAPVAPARLWATDPVDAVNQVFISDHFGLAVDLKLIARGGVEEDAAAGVSKAEGWTGRETVRRYVADRAAAVAAGLDGGRDAAEGKFRTGKFVKALAGHSVFLAKRAWNGPQ